MLLGEDAVSLLLTAGSDKGVDLLDLDGVKFLDGLLDGGLAGSAVNDEDKGVVVFNGLDSGLSSAGELDNGVFVPGVLLNNGVGDDLGVTLLGKSLGETESSLEPDLVLLDLVGTLFDGVLDGFSLKSHGHARAHTDVNKTLLSSLPKSLSESLN